MTTPGCPWPTKRVHADQAAARAAIRAMYAAGEGNPDLQPYKCPTGHWHVGHGRKHFYARIRLALASTPRRKRR